MIQNTIRLIELLRFVPRRPPGITAAELVNKLEAIDALVHLRTIQRDLQALSAHYPLVAEGKPLRWRWLAGAQGISLPPLDVSGAVIWASIALHMRAILPPDLLDEVAPQFSEAIEVLRDKKRGRGIWPRRIVRISSGVPLQPPRIDAGIYRTISECLANRRRFKALYFSRSDNAPKAMILHPLGIVLRDHLTYLVAIHDGHSSPIQLALHRFSSASALDRPARDPAGFDLAAYANGPAFGYPVGPRTRIHLRFSADAGFHLTESPLGSDQQIEMTRDGEYEVTATVENTQQLRWWLRAFGDQVEVLKPATLRNEIAEHAKSLSQIYSRSRK